MKIDSPEDRDTGTEIYRRLANAWRMASIDREVSYREIVFAPIFGPHAQVGAAIYLSVLCYPEDQTKRSNLIDALAAKVVKSSTKPKGAARRKLRKIPGFSQILDTPNKRIDQTLSDGLKRLHARFRAAWVLSQKFASSSEPQDQVSLRPIMLKAAQQNTHNYPAFGSSKLDDDQIIGSFRQRVMAPARPVAHLAMALHNLFVAQGDTEVGILKLVVSAEEWLAKVVEEAETHRVLFGDIFPSQESTYLKGRAKNYYAPTSEMIAVLPFIDPLSPNTGWETLKHLEAAANATLNQ